MSRSDELRLADILEAANQLRSIVVNLRHLLAHHYHRVDSDQIWTIATVNVPALVAQLGDGAL